MFQLRRAIDVVILLTGIMGSTPLLANPGARELLLDVSVNGVALEKIGNFTEIDGHLFATRGELRELGIEVPGNSLDDQLVALSSLADVRAALDERTQTLRLSAPVRALVPQVFDIAPPAVAKAHENETGAVFNYDANLVAGRRVEIYWFGDARLFGPFGLAQTSFTVARTQAGLRATRLETVFSRSDQDRLRTISIGDVISGSLPYSRAVRLGGVRVATNFGLRPDLITYPLPAVSGGTAVPSTVDILVNGVRQLSQPVAPGPFYVPQLPAVSGQGQLSVTVRDAVGAQSTQTSEFYIAPALLKPGLSSISVEVGAVRRNFGVASNDYRGVAGLATGRFGLSPVITGEGHVEASSHLLAGTAGMTANLFGLATVSAAGGLSRSPAGMGAIGYGALERITPTYRIGLSALVTSHGYRDVAALQDDPAPRLLVQANLGLVLGRQGSVGIVYTKIDQRGTAAQADDFAKALPDARVRGRPSFRGSLVSATYSRELFGRAYAFVTGYHDMRGHRSAITAGLSLRFGARGSLDASYATSSRQMAFAASHPEIDPGDIGWRVYVAPGSAGRATGEIRAKQSWGDVGLGVDHFGDRLFVRASARGALVMMDGAAYATNNLANGFAVVDAGGLAKVGVLLNNRLIGRTSAHGRLLVSDLVAYAPNKLGLDPADLPLDVEWDKLEAEVVPGERAGVMTRFAIRPLSPALIKLVTADGRPLPLGSHAAVAGAAASEAELGYDGQAYFAHLSGRVQLTVTSPDSTQCRADVDLGPGKDILVEKVAVCASTSLTGERLAGNTHRARTPNRP